MGCRNTLDVHIVQRPNSTCDCGKLAVRTAAAQAQLQADKDAAQAMSLKAFDYGKGWQTRAEAAEAHLQALQDRVRTCEQLLTRISQWDMMDAAADGPYWRKEIAATLTQPGAASPERTE